ncbi:hypothetical protein TGVAND_241130 [Toxoplasma gondii VAND]|uniref:Uncharacterized protein n=2 Tax=Toxoplasma gondii TaxID=5811 RepID=A0A2T6IE75_TOXGO|nr:hypothetical protein TGVAND_241130 [Toxoplasma gondii VAND]PUA83652.1 hypothetical protein TGBR9_241130 [Toxoplasma gondii TgCATBr9]
MASLKSFYGAKSCARAGRPVVRTCGFQLYSRDRSLGSGGAGSCAGGSPPRPLGNGSRFIHERGAESKATSPDCSRARSSSSSFASNGEQQQIAHRARAEFTKELSDRETCGLPPNYEDVEDWNDALSASRCSTQSNGVTSARGINGGDRKKLFGVASSEWRDHAPLCSVLDSPSPLVAALEGHTAVAGGFPVTPESSTDSVATDNAEFEGLRFVKPCESLSGPFSATAEIANLSPDFNIDKFLAGTPNIIDGNGTSRLSSDSELFVGSYLEDGKTSTFIDEPKVTAQQQTNEKNLTLLQQDISALEDLVEQTDRRLKGLGELSLKTEESNFSGPTKQSLERTPQKDAGELEGVTRQMPKSIQADTSGVEVYLPPASIQTDQSSQTDFVPVCLSQKRDSPRKEVGEEAEVGRQDKPVTGGVLTKGRMTLASLKSDRNPGDEGRCHGASGALNGAGYERHCLSRPVVNEGTGTIRSDPHARIANLNEALHYGGTASRLPEALRRINKDRQGTRYGELLISAPSGGRVNLNPCSVSAPSDLALLSASLQKPDVEQAEPSATYPLERSGQVYAVRSSPRSQPRSCPGGFVLLNSRPKRKFKKVVWVESGSTAESRDDDAQHGLCCHSEDSSHRCASGSDYSCHCHSGVPRWRSSREEIHRCRSAREGTCRARTAFLDVVTGDSTDYAHRLPSLSVNGRISEAVDGRKAVLPFPQSPRRWDELDSLGSSFAEAEARCGTQQNGQNRKTIPLNAPSEMCVLSGYNTRPSVREKAQRMLQPYPYVEDWTDTSSAASGFPPDGHWQPHGTPLEDGIDLIQDLVDKDPRSRYCSREGVLNQPGGTHAAGEQLYHHRGHPWTAQHYDSEKIKVTIDALSPLSPCGLFRPWQMQGSRLRFERDPSEDERTRCRRCVTGTPGGDFLKHKAPQCASPAKDDSLDKVPWLQVSTGTCSARVCHDTTPKHKEENQRSERVSPTVNITEQGIQTAAHNDPDPICSPCDHHGKKQDVSSQVSPSRKDLVPKGTGSGTRENPVTAVCERSSSQVQSVQPSLMHLTSETVHMPRPLCHSPKEKVSLLHRNDNSAFGPTYPTQQPRRLRQSPRPLLMNDAAICTSPVFRRDIATGASPRSMERDGKDRSFAGGVAATPALRRNSTQAAFDSSQIEDPFDVQQILAQISPLGREKTHSNGNCENGNTSQPSGGNLVENSGSHVRQPTSDAQGTFSLPATEVLEVAEACHQTGKSKSNETCEEIISTLNQTIRRIEGRTQRHEDSLPLPDKVTRQEDSGGIFLNNSSCLRELSTPDRCGCLAVSEEPLGLDTPALAAPEASLSRHHLSLELKEVHEMLIKLMEPDVETPENRCRKHALDMSSPLNTAGHLPTCTERQCESFLLPNAGRRHNRFSAEDVQFSGPAVCTHPSARASRRAARPAGAAKSDGCASLAFFESPVRVEREALGAWALNTAHSDTEDALRASLERQRHGRGGRPSLLSRATTWVLGENRTKSHGTHSSTIVSQRCSAARSIKRARSMPVPADRGARRGWIREPRLQRMRPPDDICVRRKAGERKRIPSLEVFSAVAEQPEMARLRPAEKALACKRAVPPIRHNNKEELRVFFPEGSISTASTASDPGDSGVLTEKSQSWDSVQGLESRFPEERQVFSPGCYPAKSSSLRSTSRGRLERHAGRHKPPDLADVVWQEGSAADLRYDERRGRGSLSLCREKPKHTCSRSSYSRTEEQKLPGQTAGGLGRQRRQFTPKSASLRPSLEHGQNSAEASRTAQSKSCCLCGVSKEYSTPLKPIRSEESEFLRKAMSCDARKPSDGFGAHCRRQSPEATLLRGSSSTVRMHGVQGNLRHGSLRPQTLNREGRTLSRGFSGQYCRQNLSGDLAGVQSTRQAQKNVQEEGNHSYQNRLIPEGGMEPRELRGCSRPDVATMPRKPSTPSRNSSRSARSISNTGKSLQMLKQSLRYTYTRDSTGEKVRLSQAKERPIVCSVSHAESQTSRPHTIISGSAISIDLNPRVSPQPPQSFDQSEEMSNRCADTFPEKRPSHSDPHRGDKHPTCCSSLRNTELAKKDVEVNAGFEQEQPNVGPQEIASSMLAEGVRSALSDLDSSAEGLHASAAEVLPPEGDTLGSFRSSSGAEKPALAPEPRVYPVRSMRARVQASVRKRKSQERVRRSFRFEESDSTPGANGVLTEEHVSGVTGASFESSDARIIQRNEDETQQNNVLRASPKRISAWGVRETSVELKSSLVDEESDVANKRPAVNYRQDVAVGRSPPSSLTPSWCYGQAVSLSGKTPTSVELDATEISSCDSESDGSVGREAGISRQCVTVEPRRGIRFKKCSSFGQSGEEKCEAEPTEESSMGALWKESSRSANSVLEIDMRETATEEKQ